MKRRVARTSPLLIAATALLCGACARKTGAPVRVDGSSTVYLITQAAAEELRKSEAHEVQVEIAISGTAGGFEKLCTGKTEINNASRPINAHEAELCASNQVEYVELPIAYDGLAIVVNPKNTWAASMTVAELKKVWRPEAQGQVMRWDQIRAGWPERDVRLFGAGLESGTYDYFTQAIVGTEHSSRSDYTASEDDNALVRGVADDEGALGFFGLGYYEKSKDKLKVVAIDDEEAKNGAGPIPPTPQTVRDGSYQPLSRPLFIYVARKAFERQELVEFIWFYLRNGERLVADTHFIALPTRAYVLARKRADARTTGSVFGGKGSQIGVSIEDLLARQ